MKAFDHSLQKYEAVYQLAGLAVKRYKNVDEFVAEYLS